ncbi:MAG: NADH-quinone oxidoreductase subunit C [Hyphomonadaceae bacterium]|nr:NADH-quinone oxidoreductase subunit C [Hyphomonadaceae bacterium]
MSAGLSDLAAHIASTMTNAIVRHDVPMGELTLVARAEHIVTVLTFLRDDPRCRFTTFVDLCGVDYPEREKRFDVVYHLLSMPLNQRIRIKVETDEDTAVPSVAGLFPCADWFEREAFDMYGIVFSNHPDLRRILTDYGFQGFPLRKDFPLTGTVEVRYDAEQQRVVYEPVKLQQAYRNFDFLSPWEGMTLPGDEKANG